MGKDRKRKIERESFAHTYIKPYEALSESVKDYDRLIMEIFVEGIIIFCHW